MASPQNIITAHLRKVRKEAVIGNFQKIPLWKWLGKNGAIETQDGGYVKVHPLTVGDHGETQGFKGAGYAPQRLVFKNILEEFTFEWATFASYVGISKKEKTRNKGETARIRLLETRMKNMMHAQMRDLSKRTLTGYSNGGEFSDLITWCGHSSVSTTGFFEENARASQTNNVGGHSRSGVDALQNQRADCGAAAGTNILDQQDALMLDCDLKAPMGQIKGIFCSRNYRLNLRKALRPAEQYVSDDAIDHMINLRIGGAELIVDVELPGIEGTIATGTDEFSAYFVNPDLIKVCFEVDGQFNVGEYEKVSGHFVEMAPIYTELQNITYGLAGVGLHYNADTY